MTYFRINGKPLTLVLHRNKKLMERAKEIYFAQGIEQAEKFINEAVKNGFRTRKLHMKKEDLQARRKALGISGSLMARTMGYSVSFYLDVESGKQKYSETFYKKFEKSERKLKNLFSNKK